MLKTQVNVSKLISFSIILMVLYSVLFKIKVSMVPLGCNGVSRIMLKNGIFLKYDLFQQKCSYSSNFAPILDYSSSTFDTYYLNCDHTGMYIASNSVSRILVYKFMAF